MDGFRSGALKGAANAGGAAGMRPAAARRSGARRAPSDRARCGASGADGGERGQGGEREAGEDRKADAVAAGELLGVAEAGGQIEAADAAGRADEAGDDADVAREALRHDLEHRAVAGAERAHRHDDQRQGDAQVGDPAADDQEQHRDEAVDEAQRLDAADAIGDRAAERPDERAGEHAGRRGIAGVDRGEAVLVVEVDRQERARGRRSRRSVTLVEGHQPPGVAWPQDLGVVLERLPRRRLCGLSLASTTNSASTIASGIDGEAEHVLPTESDARATARTAPRAQCRNCRRRRCRAPCPDAAGGYQ